jgi:uncharacterized damage-inducible protein DinB
MPISQSLLPEFDQEMANTRKMLERVPDANFAWKPHEKSMSMERLATHCAEIPSWIVATLELTELDLAPVGKPPMQPTKCANTAEVLATFDKHVTAARTLLEKASDEHLMQTWSLLLGGRNLFTMPRTAVLRSFCMNHLIHHRAQLGVYLRLNNVPVPGMYGPSGDEPQAF